MKSHSFWLARAVLVASFFITGSLFAEEEQQQGEKKEACHWWQFGRCDEKETIEGLPAEAPREGTVITIDLTTNTAYLFEDGVEVKKSAAATGSGKILKKGRRIWLFRTPRGRHEVLRKIVDPVWRKPDWAFIEEGQRVPAPNSPKRFVKGKLGRYALDLGEGILIHGTDDPKSIGRRVSHGCIRLPKEMLKEVYHSAEVGTEVYIFESERRVQTATGPERHSDLDYFDEPKTLRNP